MRTKFGHGRLRYLALQTGMRYRETCYPEQSPFGDAETLGLPAGGFAVYGVVTSGPVSPMLGVGQLVLHRQRQSLSVQFTNQLRHADVRCE